MLYKVTPMLSPPGEKPAAKVQRDPDAPREPRKRRKSAIFDGDGNEVLITMMCLKCRSMKPLTMFGLRKMADGAIRNQPWCRTCRSGAGTRKKDSEQPVAEAATVSLTTPQTGVVPVVELVAAGEPLPMAAEPSQPDAAPEAPAAVEVATAL